LLLQGLFQLLRAARNPFFELRVGFLDTFGHNFQLTGAYLQVCLRAAQRLLRAPAHQDVGAQGQARYRNADEKHDEQKERFIEVVPQKRPAARQRPPHCKASENDCNGRCLALVAP